jgi:carbonic anhydrase
MKKRQIKYLAVILSVMMFAGCGGSDKNSGKSLVSSTAVENMEQETYERDEKVESANDAKKLLIEGNHRFAESKLYKKKISESRRKELYEKGQKPFAAILSCSDSRVPPEVIFDQGLGDIFVIRDAGNVVDKVILGSVEYAAEHLEVPLIVVLGHEACGAVKATVDGGSAEGNIRSVVEEIIPAYDKVKTQFKSKEVLYERCAEENIKNSIEKINSSAVIKAKKTTVVGAKYQMQSGNVVFNK